MKKIAFLILSGIMFLSCKKDTGLYKVKYSVTGNTIDQYKITANTTDNFVVTPITGTKDTTVYYAAGTLVKLDVKASSTMTNSLIGSIYVNDQIVVTQTDADIDGDGKTQVKVEFALPK